MRTKDKPVQGIGLPARLSFGSGIEIIWKAVDFYKFWSEPDCLMPAPELVGKHSP
jgi:hypothetical protein